MAEKAKKVPPETTEEIKFKCRRCGRQRPLSEMRSVSRFLPVLIVCVDCAKELR
jgi:hypothetical protein